MPSSPFPVSHCAPPASSVLDSKSMGPLSQPRHEISKRSEISARHERKGARGILAKSWFALLNTALVVHLEISSGRRSTDSVGIASRDTGLGESGQPGVGRQTGSSTNFVLVQTVHVQSNEEGTLEFRPPARY